MAPLPGGRLIPTGWAAHHEPVARATMTATVALQVTGTAGGWDPTTGPNPGTTTTTLWAGPARIQRADTQQGDTTAAGQDITGAAYLVTLPKTAPAPQVGTRVKVTTPGPNADPHMAGTVLTVRSVTTGSLTWELDLLCELDETNQET